MANDPRQTDSTRDRQSTRPLTAAECRETTGGSSFINVRSNSGYVDDIPTEQVAYNYNRIAVGYVPTADGIN